jgi:hypothetical protein
VKERAESISTNMDPFSGEYKEEFDDLTSEVESIEHSVRLIAGIPEQLYDRFSELSDLKDNLPTPMDPEDNDAQSDWTPREEQEYWTISKMFEDL